MNNQFIIISCGRNCEKFVKSHMESIRKQSFQNFKHIIVDDCSDDNTVKEVMKYGTDNDILCRNNKRQYWIKNAIKYLTPHIITGEEIVVIVDLDDWLHTTNALEIVNNTYNNFKECWMTYSRMMYASNGVNSSWIPPYNLTTFTTSNFRKVIWSFTHLRTFKGFLWKELKDEDLRDENGEYFKYAYDQAVLLPMLEMSAPNHIIFIPKTLYVYNDINPNQVEKNHRKEHEKTSRYIRQKIPYQRLDR